METLTERLLKRIPNKLAVKVDFIEAEDGLIDDCKYMVYLKDGWEFCDGQTFPIKNVRELKYFLTDTTKTN
jgi:hypothetical protein